MAKQILKKMSVLNNLRRKENSLTLREDEFFAERVGCYPYHYHKNFKEHKEKDVVENAWKKLQQN